MADNYQPGSTLPVQFQPTGGVNSTLNIKGWSGDEEAITPDVSGTRHAGRTARIAAKKDHRGTVNATFDLDDPPYGAAPNIRAGTTGVILLHTSASLNKPIQIPVIITKVHYESAIENALVWSFDWAENVIAGSLVYPAA